MCIVQTKCDISRTIEAKLDYYGVLKESPMLRRLAQQRTTFECP